MRSKILFPLWLFLFAAGMIAQAQKGNPYKDIGKKGEILTLTKGEFEEFFDQEDVQQIGTNLVNIRTMKIVKMLTDDDAEKRLDNTTGKRFLSVDPLSYSYPWNSPYAYAENDIRSIDLEGAEKFIRIFSYSVSNGEPKLKVADNVWRGTWIGFKPTTEKEKIAIGFVGSNKLPSNGTFTFFEFAQEIGKANYARYDYDIGGKQHSQYFDANYIDFMYEELGIAQDKLLKGLNVLGATANLGGAGAFAKSELKAASGELKAPPTESPIITPTLDKVGRRKAYA